MLRSTLALATVIFMTAPALAQVPDHLKCYTIKDPVNLSGVVDLNSPQFGVEAGCRISRAHFFCVSATKDVVSAMDKATGMPITPLPVSGPDAGDRVCYKIKCPVNPPPPPPNTLATDQFGTRTFTNFRASLLCAPAVVGTPVPTPTPTPTSTPPRFVDNGDGTVTDNQTGLQWEKKTGTVGFVVDCSFDPCPDPHYVNNSYWWTNSDTAPDGPAFTDFLGKLNNCTSSDGTAVTNAGFAGHCDWRLPTIQELQTILDTSRGFCVHGIGTCIDPVFGPTVADVYWSATTATSDPSFAWDVGFGDGFVIFDYKGFNEYVRAVRTGS